MRIIFLIIAMFELAACSGANVRTFTDPALSSEPIKSIAVFPLRNGRFSLTDSMEIDRKFTSELHRRAPSLHIMGPSETVEKVNSAGLQNELSTFLINYDTSGVPDQIFLKQLGAALKVDAMIQGRVFGLRQQDGGVGSWGTTQVSVGYSMVGATSGRVLWDSVSEATVNTGGHLAMSAPPITDAIQVAADKILDSLPFNAP